MKKASKPIQVVLCITLFAAGIAFCIVAFWGHTPAYPASAVCFFTAVALTEKRRKNND